MLQALLSPVPGGREAEPDRIGLEGRGWQQEPRDRMLAEPLQHNCPTRDMLI
jgi:hypothetical protein